MPRDGSITLSDVSEPTLSVVCEPCGRHGRYSVAQLMEQHGDAKLTDLLHILADCPKASSVHDRCKAVFGQRLPRADPQARTVTVLRRGPASDPTPTELSCRS